MVGVGVLVSAGFMVADLTPWQILLAWVVGGITAMAGARAYATLSHTVPRSGGEYRFLSELAHPALGTFAGWTSLILGFSAPVASAASTAGPFAQTLFPIAEPRIVGTILILLMTCAQAFNLRFGKIAQNILASAKIILISGFAIVGMLFGSHSYPAWIPTAGPQVGGALFALFMGQLLWVSYAYSGWNAAVYVAEEFKEPRKNVPRAMVLGCVLVMAIYLLVNWVFIANLHPEQMTVVRPWLNPEAGKITLGHLITENLIGPLGGKVMSIFVLVALTASISAMTLVGPRVYAVMARDGFLPRFLAGEGGKPPLFSVFLQSAIALVLLWWQSFAQITQNVSAVLMIVATLTVLTLYRVAFSSKLAHLPRPGLLSLASATLFATVSLVTVYFAIKNKFANPLWMAVLVGVSGVAYAITSIARKKPPTDGAEPKVNVM
jgi:basic amino acid/polyamine antiporter, APA family